MAAIDPQHSFPVPVCVCWLVSLFLGNIETKTVKVESHWRNCGIEIKLSTIAIGKPTVARTQKQNLKKNLRTPPNNPRKPQNNSIVSLQWFYSSHFFFHQAFFCLFHPPTKFSLPATVRRFILFSFFCKSLFWQLIFFDLIAVLISQIYFQTVSNMYQNQLIWKNTWSDIQRSWLDVPGTNKQPNAFFRKIKFKIK